MCPKDAKQCPDGSVVNRVPPNCDFASCPVIVCPVFDIAPCSGTVIPGGVDKNGCALPPACCGDGRCDARLENSNNCPTDCGGSVLTEEVKCVFDGSSSSQKCYSDKGVGCDGVGTCVTKVSGQKGEKVTWKSSCGGSATTVIDGQSDYAKFECTKTVKEPVTCLFNGAKSVQECYSSKGKCASSDNAVDYCVVWIEGLQSEGVEWKSSCGGYAMTRMDGQAEQAKFSCSGTGTCANAGQACGGIASVQCCGDLSCKMSGNYPNYPDASGVCVKNTNPSCRNKVCEKGEAYCPACRSPPCTVTEACGLCPEDCVGRVPEPVLIKPNEVLTREKDTSVSSNDLKSAFIGACGGEPSDAFLQSQAPRVKNKEDLNNMVDALKRQPELCKRFKKG